MARRTWLDRLNAAIEVNPHIASLVEGLPRPIASYSPSYRRRLIRGFEQGQTPTETNRAERRASGMRARAFRAADRIATLKPHYNARGAFTHETVSQIANDIGWQAVVWKLETQLRAIAEYDSGGGTFAGHELRANHSLGGGGYGFGSGGIGGTGYTFDDDDNVWEYDWEDYDWPDEWGWYH